MAFLHVVPPSYSEELANQLAHVLLSVDFQANLLASLIVAAVLAAFRLFAPKARIVWSNGHAFAFNVPLPNNEPPQPLSISLFTKTVFIANVGRSPAEGVELQLTITPHHFQVWPPTAYTSHTLKDGVFVLFILSIAARERLSVELLNVNVIVPNTIRVKSKAAEAQFVPKIFSRIYPIYLRILLVGAIMLGSFYALRLSIAFILRAIH